MTASLEDRRKLHRAQRLRRVLTGIGVVLVLAGLVAVLWFSPLLALHSVKAQSSDLVDGGEVQSFVLEKHKNQPLPQIRQKQLEDELAEEFPLAKTFDVGIGGLHTLKVKVEDRTPAFTVGQGDQWDLYDQDGVNLGTEGQKPKDLPVFIGTADKKTLAAASQVIQQMPDDADKLQAVAVKSPREAAVILQPKKDYTVTVLLGEPDDIGEKLTIAKAIMKDEPGAIDVQSTSVPASMKTPPEWARNDP